MLVSKHQRVCFKDAEAAVASDGGGSNEKDAGNDEASGGSIVQPNHQVCRFCELPFDDPMFFIQHLRESHKKLLKAQFLPGKCYFPDCSNRREKWTMYYIDQHLQVCKSSITFLAVH